MERDKIRLLQQRFEGCERLRVPKGELRAHVEVHHPHSQKFSEQPDLGADVPIADDSQCLAANLAGAAGALFPSALVDLLVAVPKLPGEHDDFGEDQLSDGARVGKRRIENDHTAPHGSCQIDLVGPNAKAADCQQLSCARRIEDPRRQLGLRANPQKVHTVEGRNQLVLAKRLLEAPHRESGILQLRFRDGVNAFQEKDVELGHDRAIACGFETAMMKRAAIRTWVAFLAIAAGISIVAGYLEAQSRMLGPDIGTMRLEVSKGEIAGTLTPRLVATGLIKTPLVFRWTVWRRGGLKLKAGKHRLSTPLSPQALADALETAPPADELPFVIVEGARRADVDRELVEEGRGMPGAYLAATAHGRNYNTAFPLPDGSLEGYLFPETYQFPVGPLDPQSLVQRQLDAFRERIFTPLSAQISASKHSLHELVVMASLLEREEDDPANRPLVAGILWKRFDRRLPLGVDATSRYTLETWSDRKAFLIQLRDPSDPYNTRLRAGLPPTAIGAVTRSSFEAALNPLATEALYYLHDANKKLHTAKDAEGHERNRKTYGVY